MCLDDRQSLDGRPFQAADHSRSATKATNSTATTAAMTLSGGIIDYETRTASADAPKAKSFFTAIPLLGAPMPFFIHRILVVKLTARPHSRHVNERRMNESRRS
jgi:hypothetical protein